MGHTNAAPSNRKWRRISRAPSTCSTKAPHGDFPGTPYEHDALGTRPSFDKTNAAMLQKFHDNWYAPNNAILIIVGDVDPNATLTEVKSLFGAIPAKKLPPRPKFDLAPVQPSTSARRPTSLTRHAARRFPHAAVSTARISPRSKYCPMC